MTDLGLSFVICCYNGAARVPKVLEHIAAQQIEPPMSFEVVVVDNASTDGTAEEARRCWAALGTPAPLRVIHESVPGIAHARIAGIAAARYDVLSFVDDDNWIGSSWCATVLTLMAQSPRLAALGARGSPAFEQGPPPSWFQRYQSAYAVGPQRSDRDGQCDHIYGAGLSVRKSALNALTARGFVPLLAGRTGAGLDAGEDAEICFALKLAGWELSCHPDLVFQHAIPRKRLDEAYLLGLYRGFGRSSARQDIYRWIERNRGVPPSRLALYLGLRALFLSATKATFWGCLSLSPSPNAPDRRLRRKVAFAYHSSRWLALLENWRRARSHIEKTLAWLQSDVPAEPERI